MKNNSDSGLMRLLASTLRLVPIRLCAAVLFMFVNVSNAADVEFVVVMKGQEYYQSSPHVVSIGEWQEWYRTEDVQNEGEHRQALHVFESFVVGSEPGVLLEGSVTPPDGEAIPLLQNPYDDDSELIFKAGADSPHELNADWPDGIYTVAVQSLNDAPFSVALNLAGGVYPAIPQVINFNSMQSLDSALDFTVEWSPMGGAATDFIMLSIWSIDEGGQNGDEIVFETAAPGMTGALNGTDTQTLIPAGTLQPGRDYQGELLFVKTTDVKTSPAMAIAGYYKLTGFRIRTAALANTSLGAQFLRSVPANNLGVPRDTVVAFRFSHPMSTHPEHRIVYWMKEGAAFFPSVNYHWVEEDRVLLCEFAEALPANSQIEWTLGGFRDAAGFVVESLGAGAFQTEMDNPKTPPDVDLVSFFKTRYFVQSGESPLANGRWEAIVEVEANAPNRLKSASFTALTDATVRPLYADPWRGDDYESPGEYAAKADLDRFYPNGAYAFNLDGVADGAYAFELDTGATDAYPDAPQVTNLANLQAIDATQDFIITWQALSDWQSNLDALVAGDGVIGFEIVDAYGRHVYDGWDEGPTTSTSQVIPAGTLKPGRSYNVELSFIRITDVYDGALPINAVAGFESISTFAIGTGGEPSKPMLGLSRSGPQAVLTTSQTEPDMAYLLEVSTDLQRWKSLTQFWSQDETFVWEYHDWDAQYLKARFYRIRETGFFQPSEIPVTIQGTVWNDDSYTTPLAGVVVGTSLDNATTLTAADGSFFLSTDTPLPVGDYTIKLQFGSELIDYGPFDWGDQARGLYLVKELR